MSPIKGNAQASKSTSQRRKKVTPSQRQKPRKAFRQRKIPKTLDGVPVFIYGAPVEHFVNGDTTIKPRALVVPVSESAPSRLHVATPQGTVSLGSPGADFVDLQIPASYLGAEPSHRVPIPFQYDLDSSFNLNSQAEDIFPLTNSPCQSYYAAGQYDPSYLFLPPSSSTSSLGVEHGVEPYHCQQWPDPNTQYIIPQPPNPSYYVSHASSTFPGNYSANNIYAEFPGSSHLMMMSANLNDGTLTENNFPFPNYDPNDLQVHGYDFM